MNTFLHKKHVVNVFLCMMLFGWAVDVHAQTTYYARNISTDSGLCAGFNNSLSTTAGASLAVQGMSTAGTIYCFEGGDMTTTLESGDWGAFVDLFTTGSGQGSPARITIEIVDGDTGSIIETIADCTTTNNPSVEQTCSTSGVGEKTLTNDFVRLTVHKVSGNRTVSVRYNNTAGGDADSRITIPSEVVLSTPTVSTDAETNVTAVSATLNGTVSADGGSSVTSRGFAWGLSSTLQDAFGTSTNGTGTGSFSDNVSGLVAGTTYYYRAYAVNSTGTGYGTIEQLTAGTDTTPTRMMRLFEGFMLRLLSGTLILYQR